jgi:nucleoside-diphosphate-sugar epimerase
MKMKRILITGGMGYVGSRLAIHLKSNPSLEIHLTTTRTVLPEWIRAFYVHELNILNKQEIHKLLEIVRPDAIVHLAGLPQAKCQSDPDMARAINVDGSRKLAEAAAGSGVRRLIFTSTFQVYGSLKGKITEDNPLDPQNEYARTKVEAEQQLQEVARSSAMELVVLRLANGYGCPAYENIAASAWGLIFNAFCRKAVDEGIIEINSNQYRNYITLTDITRAVEFFIFKDICKSEIYNLGGSECLSVLQVAERVSSIFAKHFNGVKIPVRQLKDLPQSFPFDFDSSKLHNAGFTLLNNSEEEILNTLLFCKKVAGGKTNA